MRIDLVIGIVVGVVVLVTTHGSPTGTPIEPATLTAVLVACAALTLRRRHPFAAFLVSSIAAEAYLILNHSSTNGTMILAAPLITLYTVAESQSRRRALAIGVLAVLTFAGLHMLVKPSSWLGAENLALAALGGLAVAAGDGARSRREYLAEVEDRARLAEQEHEAEALRRVTEERLRIARDLHDAVGHQLALITVQAGVATQLLDTAPARAREALAHVRRAGRTALDELSDTIGLLRRPDEPALPLDPLPGLAALPALVAAHRAAGQSITVVGPGFDSPDLSVAAHRAAGPGGGEPELPVVAHRAAGPAGDGPELPVVAHRAGGPGGGEPDLSVVAHRTAERSIAGSGPAGGGAALPVAVDLTAYRVIQEALTNACKHAPGAPIRLSVTNAPQLLHIRVDNGPGPPSTSTAARSRATAAASGARPASSPAELHGETAVEPGAERAVEGRLVAGAESAVDGRLMAGAERAVEGRLVAGAGAGAGLGLVGMRERVLALGGSLTAGPRPDGGYRVDARLPHSAATTEPKPDLT
ncbi:sensor histidine kinase [Dactylosporangium sp. CS-047395]|uniref:sensor histidine kinase n=1 Tax=Dactylosporangium sp. CS-047395 TaxID=3239936 RepID=UPI003D89E396